MQARGETLAAIAELAGVKVGDVRIVLKSTSAQPVIGDGDNQKLACILRHRRCQKRFCVALFTQAFDTGQFALCAFFRIPFTLARLRSEEDPAWLANLDRSPGRRDVVDIADPQKGRQVGV
jgi:hypothetical protein